LEEGEGWKERMHPRLCDSGMHPYFCLFVELFIGVLGEQILSGQIHLMLYLSHPIHFYCALFIEIKNIEGWRSN
jgi:hypothetical protein